MSVGLYMDVHVRSAVTAGLRQRGVDVLIAQDDGTRRLPDVDLLDRATSLGRVLFTQDRDFLREATLRQRSGRTFAGIAFVEQNALSDGECIGDLEIIAKASKLEDVRDQVYFLPL